MPTTAVVSPGFRLDYEDPDAAGTWIHVGQAVEFDGPSESTEEADITNQDSTGGFREFVATLQDGGTVTFDVIGNPADAGQVAMAQLKHDRLTVDWRLTFPENTDGEVYGLFFAGFINQLGNSFPLADAWRRSCGIRVSGPVVQDLISS